MRVLLHRLWLGCLYPGYLAWGSLLYYAELRQPAHQPNLLRLHPAFFHASYPLRLYGLDAHLVLVAERHPADARQAITGLGSGLQRWAAQNAQVELNLRLLERCPDAEALAKCHQTLTLSELTATVNDPLNRFSRFSQEAEAILAQENLYYRRLALANLAQRLNRWQRELGLSDGPYLARFYNVASLWYTVILELETRLRQEAETERLIENPYIFGVPLTSEQEIFVGRADIVTRIEQLLLDHQRPPVLLYGQRRMGKTSLLHNLKRLLSSRIVPLFVDGEALEGAKDYAELLSSLARHMARSAQLQGLHFPDLPYQRLVDSPFRHFNTWLDTVENTLTQQGNRIALLALDEFEALAAVTHKGNFDEADVLRLLRHIVQHRTTFKLLLAGSHTLDDLGEWAGHLINTQLVRISYLEPEEAKALITQPKKGFPLNYEPETVNRILALTRGHPYLVQLLCYELVNLKNNQPVSKRKTVVYEDVAEAIFAAMHRGSLFFAEIEQGQIEETERALLDYIARQPFSSGLDLDILQRQFGPPAILDRALSSLAQRQLIEKVNENYRFQVELIHRWFAGQR